MEKSIYKLAKLFMVCFLLIMIFNGCNNVVIEEENESGLTPKVEKKQSYKSGIDLEGNWIFNANGYLFILELKQDKNKITGVLKALNHSDDDSSIEGTIAKNEIHFYRSRKKREVYQEYTGYLFKSGIHMAGIFIHENRGKNGWFASREPWPRAKLKCRWND